MTPDCFQFPGEMIAPGKPYEVVEDLDRPILGQVHEWCPDSPARFAYLHADNFPVHGWKMWGAVQRVRSFTVRPSMGRPMGPIPADVLSRPKVLPS